MRGGQAGQLGGESDDAPDGRIVVRSLQAGFRIRLLTNAARAADSILM